jgi:ATP phosphoribosyltransferase
MTATIVSSAPFVIAVPSKGRLQENAAAFFARAGLTLVQGRGARDYRGRIAELDNIEIAYVSAAEIVGLLANGSAHMGITGEDLLRESLVDADSKVSLLAPLGFGHANVVVAVPQAWIDVKTMADLEDVASAFRARRGTRMRVATKYVNLTRRFFAAEHVNDYRIVESMGATEGAPAAGAAELIVDITTTGATLAANGLKVLDDGVILRSEANLVAALAAAWDPQSRETARALLSRIAAEEAARTTREVTAILPSVSPQTVAKAEASFAARERRRTGDGLIALACPANNVAALADWLIAQGAEDVTVSALDYVFSATNPLYDKLVARLG